MNKYKNKVLFLAEKVETRVDYEEALKMGYDLFQGFFFSKPVLMKSKEIKTLNVHLLQIMDELRKEEPDFSFIAETIKRTWVFHTNSLHWQIRFISAASSE